MTEQEMAAGVEEIHAAWKAIERKLLTLVEAMVHPQDRLVLEVGEQVEVPVVAFRMQSGALCATVGDDEYTENHAIGREPLVHRAIMLLRNIVGVPHPQLLTHRAQGPCAQLSPVLGLAWTGGPRPAPKVYVETDREALVDIVEEALSDDYEVFRDEDDDLFVEHLGQRVWVRVLPDAPAIVISTRVTHGARSRRQAAVEVGILNRSNAWVWWQVIGRDIVQTATVEAMPFAPHHLMTTMEVFLDAMATRDDLALRVGGEVA
ncbi:hypothetical protein NYE39_00590 [Janibacter sp. FSL W8-0316]|uniref:T3SS (YopN, CesT) and YbjN peptide-binding chaperone 1 n=1 Tax=Janibacter sp. FSL W8-0316 TaxID=2975325 RepID=UPI0030F7AA5D